MKKILMTISVVCLAFCVKAQDNKFSLGVGPAASLPTGDFSQFAALGLGSELQAKYAISSSIDGFVQAGYQSFSGKTVSVFGIDLKYPSSSVIPVLVGAKYKIGGRVNVGAGIGYGSFSVSGVDGEKGTSTGGFAYSPQLGYSFSKIDVVANYTSFSITGGNLSFFGLKAYYNFMQ